MKMFELQLKLFEMQYLLNGGDPNAALRKVISVLPAESEIPIQR